MHFTLRETALYGILGALLVAVQLALAVIPNVELVSLLIVVFALELRGRVFFPIAIFVAVECLIFGFGLWSVNYLYVWAVLAAVVLLVGRRAPNAPKLVYVAINGVFGLLFGALCALPYLAIGGASSAFAYWVSGIPFDLLHCAGNILTAVLLYTPIRKLTRKLYDSFIR